MDAIEQLPPVARDGDFEAALTHYLATATAAFTVDDHRGTDMTWASSYALADAMRVVIECFPRQHKAEADRKLTGILEQIVDLRQTLSKRWWELPRRNSRAEAGTTALQSAIDELRADFHRT